ncbi:MAG: thiamine pyrophosphate-dependent enzyme [Smithellaceae bacterium]|nr:thiamine pyrophosphate-dependent enzyme [Smithellaceae bacterium]NLX52824.1 2-oxoacid:ferredoxin oxidoreductase subunit beta [Deltaproteobacteria bacterium]
MITAKTAKNLPPHPMDSLLRTERIPHIWCPGCGIGTVFSAVIHSVKNSGLDPNNIAMVSGIGCTGRMAGYIRLDSFHTTHGRALPFATGLKLAKPDTKIIVVSGDGDLLAIGGNHFIHAARRNMDLTVICVNNLNYGMTGGQQGPSTPLGAKTTTTVNGSPEEPFNFCYLAAACGATYVARWTAMQVRSLRSSISEALDKRGFSFVEVITPCPSSFGRRNRMGTALEMLKFYHGRSVIRSDIDPRDASMDIDREIVVGKFVDIERPTFMDHYEKVNRLNSPQWRAMHPDQKAR